MSNKKEALGKGIRALLDGIETSYQSPKGEDIGALTNSVLNIPLAAIEVNPFQPRVEFDESKLKELSDSIKIHGVIQPITVKKIGAKRYQLIAGERRLRATKMAGISDIPAFIRNANDQEMLEIALIENTHREDLNSLEVAINYKRLMDECNLTQEQMAERVGKDRATVANYLRLLKLPPDIQAALKNRNISMAHARSIINIDDPVAQLSLYKEIINKELSVREVEKLAREFNQKRKTHKINETDSLPFEYKRIQDKIASFLSTRVILKPKRGGRGEIVINYFSDDDLERLMELMKVD
jgi:ParB family chromosome partitioning protein